MIKIIVFSLIYTVGLFSKELITPIPLVAQYDYEKALLGKKLFFDTMLSHDNSISCASCHFLEDGGDDNIAISVGIDGKKGIRNSPTVLNAVYNVTQFWDGRAKDLQSQARVPIHNSVEMGSSFQEIIPKLSENNYYKQKFGLIYRDGITGDNITNAIAEFEKSLTTPNSRFDRFLRGDKKALSNDELDGYKAFKEYGCISCHNGINIGGNLIQKIGVIEAYKSADLGRFNVTKKEEDRFYFKVPTLRNVELTAPYFHNGKIKTLKEAVEKMVKHQVGFFLSEKELEDIVKFLKTLTGEKVKIIEDNR